MTDDGIMSWLSLSFWSDPPSCNYKGNQSYKPVLDYNQMLTTIVHNRIFGILVNPGVTHSVPTSFNDEWYGMGHAWITEDDILMVYPAPKPYFCFYFFIPTTS